MKTRYIFFLAAMGLLASCTKEADAPQMNEEIPSGAKTYLTVNLDKATKTYLGSDESLTHKVYWSNGDQIKVDEYSSEPLSGLDGDNLSATFIINGVLSDDPHNVLYPLSAWEDATHISLPAVQEWADGNIANNMLPLAAQSAGSITLKHLCAILKIQVRQENGGDTHKIRTIRFKGRNYEKVSGSFVINYATPALTATTGTGTDLVTRITHDQATSTETPVVYYLVVPARTYSDGFQVDVLDEKGHCMTKNKLTGTTLEAGHMYTMDPFEFVPTTTEVGIEISNAQQLINFVTDFNEGNIARNANATLVSDIVFDAETSAAFNATGGVQLNGGGSKKYYNGVFNGNGYSISGLEATVPLFNVIGAATIKDFTLNGSLTYTQPGSGNDNVGPIAKQLQGTLSNVTVNTSVSIVGVSRTVLLDLGGMVGRANSETTSINNCKFNGSILIPAEYTNTKRVYIGGIAGYTTQPFTIQNSSFGGTIKYLGSSTLSYNEDAPGVSIGGIVGCNQKATVQNCTSVDSKDKASIIIGETEYKASIIAQSATVNYVAIGGIVGYNFDENAQVKSSCTNYATILDNITSSTSYLSVGGVVGTNSDNTYAGSVSDATNYGVLTHMSTCPNQRLGGVIGFDEGTTSDCSNEASGTVTVDAAAQQPRVGGVIGEKASGTITGNISNKADISINALTAGAYGCRLGGVVGSTSIAIDGGDSYTVTNSGKVSLIPQVLTTGDCGVGGIVGYSTANVSGAANSGIVYCMGLHTPADSESNHVATKNVCMGGILGLAGSSITVSGCINSKSVKYEKSVDKKSNRCPSYIGGIVGKMADGGTISSCTNSAGVWNHNYNNNSESLSNPGTPYSPYCGGIVGALVGTSTSPGIITDVHKTTVTNNDNYRCRAKRGYIGGIAGYVSYTTIGRNSVADDCTNESVVFGITSVYGGGLVGEMYQSSMVNTKCTGSIYDIEGNANVAGLVYKMDGDSSVENCIFNGTLTYAGTGKGGYVAYTAASGATISNCQVGGTDNGAAITSAADDKICPAGSPTIENCTLLQ